MVAVLERKAQLEARLEALEEKLREIDAELDSHQSRDWEELAVERESDELDAAYVADSTLAAEEITNRNSAIGQAGEMVAAATGIPWLLPLLSIGTTATAAGAVYDNRRKDKKIREQKSDS